jgi:hypothetical protein
MLHCVVCCNFEFWKINKKFLGCFVMWFRTGMKKISWVNRVKNKELRRGEERRKAKLIGHFLLNNCL